MITPWITVGDLADAPFTGDDLVLAQEAIASASFVLFMLSGRKYGGVRTVTEEYCQVGLRQLGSTGRYSLLPGASGYPAFYPELRDGIITNVSGDCCSSCGCTHLIRLRAGPVRSVTSVYDGDDPVPLGDIAIYDYSYITTPPGRCWSTCGDLEVTYTYGAPPPALGKVAAKAMADQYIYAMTGSDECTLPQRVTSVSRQGVSWTLLDPQDFLDRGLTGIYQVDLFLRTVNPDQARLRARVFSPDVHRGKSYRWANAVIPAGFSAGDGGAGAGGLLYSAEGSQLTVAPSPMLMSLPRQPAPAPVPVPSPVTVAVYPGQPLRWVVPGPYTEESSPTVVVRPSGEEVPPDALLWRTGNYTLDLSSEQVEQLLPPGSVLVVSSTGDDGKKTGEASYPVERRTL